MKVFLEDEWLHTGTYEEQSSVEVALPGGGTGVVDEVDQQPGQDQVKKVNVMKMFTLIIIKSPTDCCASALQIHSDIFQAL